MYSIALYTSTKTVQGSKLALPRVHLFLYRQIEKALKYSCLKQHGLESRYLVLHCLMDLYQDCSNNTQWIKIGPAPSVLLLKI